MVVNQRSDPFVLTHSIADPVLLMLLTNKARAVLGGVPGAPPARGTNAREAEEQR